MDIKRKNLIIFTGSFPFSAEQEDSFIMPELPYLTQDFNVTIVPLSNAGTRNLSLPEGVEVDDSFSRIGFPRLQYFNLIFLYFFWKELFINFQFLLHPASFKKMVHHLSVANKLKQWISEKILKVNKADDYIFYSYWFHYQTTALALLKPQTSLTFVSRAHGIDLYDFRHVDNYIPFRKQVLGYISKVFLISEHGFNYLCNKFPEYKHKYQVGMMGTFDPGFLVKSSTDESFNIVSCSSIIPVKRVKLILESIRAFGEKCPDTFINWTHIGDGPTLRELIDEAELSFSKNIKAFFKGNIANEDVISFYKSQELDLFIMLSESEGKPVAIMEAISVGLPILSTNVGGIPEMVKGNGVLVDKGTKAHEVGEELKKLAEGRERLNRMKIISRNLWERELDGNVNFSTFSSILNSLQSK